MKLFNAHRTEAKKLERLLNAHMERGWDLHHIRQIGSTRKDNVFVLFVRQFDGAVERDAYLAARRDCHAREAPPPDDDAPTVAAPAREPKRWAVPKEKPVDATT